MDQNHRCQEYKTEPHQYGRKRIEGVTWYHSRHINVSIHQLYKFYYYKFERWDTGLYIP